MPRTRDHCHCIERDRHGAIRTMAEIGAYDGFSAEPWIDDVDTASRV
jgi:hypothetical protein